MEIPKNKGSTFTHGNNPQDLNRNYLFHTGMFSPIATIFSHPVALYGLLPSFTFSFYILIQREREDRGSSMIKGREV